MKANIQADIEKVYTRFVVDESVTDLLKESSEIIYIQDIGNMYKSCCTADFATASITKNHLTPRPGFEPGYPEGNRISNPAHYQIMRPRLMR